MRAPRAVAAIAVVVLAGCSAASPESAPTPLPSPSSPTPSPTASPSPPPPTPPPTPSPPPPVFSTSAAAEVVQTLAGDIGPREATSASFTAAADYVQARLTELGYEVARPAFSVPAGESWGVPVPAGETANVVATAPGTSLDEPFLVVGAHLDTVPVAPGAVDNASGIAVLLEVARMATLDAPPVPVVLVAFGAEEPRGPGDDLHHFGSQAFVRGLSPAQRAALVGAVAIDSVGISPDVPICTAVAGADPFTQAVREAARSAGVPVRECENRTSDHWSFVRSGLPGVRVGLAGTQEYAEYHSAADVPAVVDLDRLRRAGEAVWAAVSAGAAGTAG